LNAPARRWVKEIPCFVFSTEEEAIMSLKQGEIYTCTDAKCGCEIKVIKSAAPGCTGTAAPRCCCGKEMTIKK